MCNRPTFIYIFTSALPGRNTYHYVGKHQPKLGHDFSQWPKRGHGPMPDGYKGSGTAAWYAIVKKRGHAHLAWRVLRVVPTGGDYQAVEKRAIRLAGCLLGRRCVNAAPGGDGFTSECVRSLWQQDDYREKVSTAARANALTRWTAPTFREKVTTAVSATCSQPQYRLKKSGEALARWADPDYQERMSARVAASNRARATLCIRPLEPCVGFRPNTKSIPLLRTLAVLLRPEGASREDLVDALEVSPARTGELINDVNKYLGYGITAIAPGRYKITAPPL